MGPGDTLFLVFTAPAPATTAPLPFLFASNVSGDAAVAAPVVQSCGACSPVLLLVAAAVMAPLTWRLVQRMAADVGGAAAVAAAVMQSRGACSPVLLLVPRWRRSRCSRAARARRCWCWRRHGAADMMLVQRMSADIVGDAAEAAAVMHSCGTCSPVLVLVAAAVMQPPT